LVLSTPGRNATAKIGIIDSLGRVFLLNLPNGQLFEITATLNKPIIDFEIAGDSIFALGKNNVLYIAHLGTPIVWQKDSIHCNRKLKGISLFQSYFSENPPGRYNPSSDPYFNSALLLYGSGNSVISTSKTYLWTSPGSVKEKVVNHLSIYPNPVTQRSFRTTVEGISNLQLFDIQGRNLATLPATENDNQTFEIPSRIKSGYYVVKGMLKGQLYIGKVVVQ